MREAEIEPLISLVCGGAQVLGLFVFGHGVPDSLPPAVDRHVEELRADEQADVVCNDTQQNLVAGVVIWLVGLPIDLDNVSIRSSCQDLRTVRPTLLPIMLLACTHMLYNALATVRVLTVPALRLVMATISAWQYGCA